MSRRSRRHWKRFECGHRGFGRFCHRCADLKRKQEGDVLTQEKKRKKKPTKPTKIFNALEYQPIRGKKRKKKSTKPTKEQMEDVIELGHLPRSIMEKARKVLGLLEQGANWFKLGGKQFHFDRSLMRIPVGYRYRLLCRWDQSGITPLAVMTHEAYNPVARNKKRA